MTPRYFSLGILTFTLSAQALLAQQPAPAKPEIPAPGTTTGEVGVSSRDGISVSGTDVLVSRNGRTEKLLKEMELPGGIRVKLDGMVMFKDGSSVALRPTQVLTFDGKIMDAPVVESVAPKANAPAVPTAPPVAPAPVVPTPPRTGPIKAGEGVQK